MEKWNAYTRNGKLTDKVLIRGGEIPEGLYHLVSEVLVRHKDGSWLCMKRATSKESYPGYYEATAGGSALMGEDSYACAKRELKEETGIACDELELVGVIIRDDQHTLYHCYTCTVDCDKNSVKLQEGETEDYVWMNEAEFMVFVNSDRMIDGRRERFAEYYRKLGYI